MMYIVFFFKQKTAYEMRISDWSSDVCSSDLKNALVKQALAETDSLLETDPDDPYFLELKGQILLESGKPGEALEALRRATALSGNQPLIASLRSEERRVGKECVSTCRSRWSRWH